MARVRVIARLDVKNEYVIKGIHLEGLRKIGDPNEMARRYYESGIDEILFIDAVAAYYDRNSLSHIIEKACDDVFVPITVGGGIRTLADIQKALNAGADKVAINTQAVKDPGFISEASQVFGAQCIVASVVAKKQDHGWEAYTDNGREPSGKDVFAWVQELEGLGAGEILLTSVDQDGTKKGFDLELVQGVSARISIPVIVSGGAGNVKDVVDLSQAAHADAVALGSLLHYDLAGIRDVKDALADAGVRVRI